MKKVLAISALLLLAFILGLSIGGTITVTGKEEIQQAQNLTIKPPQRYLSNQTIDLIEYKKDMSVYNQISSRGQITYTEPNRVSVVLFTEIEN